VTSAILPVKSMSRPLTRQFRSLASARETEAHFYIRFRHLPMRANA
jgi:hypothetical protein